MQSFWRAAAPDKNTRTGKGERLWQKQNVHTPIVNVRRRSAKQVQRGRRSIAAVTARVRVRRATAVVSAAIRAVSTRKRSSVFNSLTNDPQARLGIDVAVSRDMKILRTIAKLSGVLKSKTSSLSTGCSTLSMFANLIPVSKKNLGTLRLRKGTNLKQTES